MVIDTSAILAIFFEEKHATWVADQMKLHAPNLYMSTVNLTETLILIQARQPNMIKDLEKDIFSGGIRFISPDIEQSKIASIARFRHPFNLGDCFAYALAVTKNLPILTLDTDFKGIDHPVYLPPL